MGVMLHLTAEQRQELIERLCLGTGGCELWIDGSGEDGAIVRVVGEGGDVAVDSVEWVSE